MKSFGPLYAKASTGKIKVWKADVADSGCLVTSHGYIDGALTTDSKYVKGKNIGKSNETTPYNQACSEAQSKMNRKIDEGYVQNQADAIDSSSIAKLAWEFNSLSWHISRSYNVDKKLHEILDRIEKKAEKIGTSLHNKAGKIAMWGCFITAVLIFGFFAFFSKFTRSLFGIKD